MFLLLAVLALLFAEVVAFVAAVDAFGVVMTLLAMLLFAAGGAWLVKREGLEAWRRVNEGLRAGRIPAGGLVDAFLVMIAGALLLVPGFVTDFLGLLLLIPPIRSLASRSVMGSIERRVSRRVRVVGSRLGSSPRFDPSYESPFEAQARETPWRSYRRPDEPDPSTSAGVVGATPPDAARHGAGHGEVIDLDAEEYFVGDPAGELEPPTSEG